MSLVSYWIRLVAGECVACWVHSHSYLMMDRSVGEAAAPGGTCIPIMLVLCLFEVVLGGTKEVYDVGIGKKTLTRSLLLSSIDHVEGMFCLGRRVGKMGGWGL